MQEHDGEQFAGLCEDEGYVVDVRERGIAEGGGKRGGKGDEEKRDEDGARWYDRWEGFSLRCGREEI